MHPEGDDKREFLRIDHEKPINFKVLKSARLISRSDVASRNISASGLLFRTSNEISVPALSSIVWIELDQNMIGVCSEIEQDLVTFKNGVYGRVVRIAEGEPGISFDIGVCFLRKSRMTENEIKELASV
ncbi:MAG: hypothetical protein PHT95_02480 [Candidatus Omnitrophica bacterium]|nr:hypothetical protein [Candidatus Omnitrophota bacterium]MDD4012693.1 hypothetical protein [Candidatus Omnitrophota bacterium]